jgi:hypothetical protein
MSQLINIFLEPGKVFAELREKPSFLLPALLVALATAAVAAIYFFRVDPAWFTDYQIAAAGREMSAAEIEQAKQFMPGARTLAYITAPMVLVTFTIMYALYALYYLLAGKVTGNPVSYRHGLALAAWGTMPMLLGAVVALVGIFISSNQSSFESMQLLNVDPLFVQLPTDHAWSSLAKGFSLLNFWVWFLVALGWKTWFRTGWGQAIFVSVLPGIVIYGIWAAFAAF